MKKFLSQKMPAHVLRSALVLIAASVAVAPAAKADSVAFAFGGGGLLVTGQLDYSPAAVPGVVGAHQITGITGTFTDTNAGISGAIVGLEPAGLPTINPDGVTFYPALAQVSRTTTCSIRAETRRRYALRARTKRPIRFSAECSISMGCCLMWRAEPPSICGATVCCRAPQPRVTGLLMRTGRGLSIMSMPLLFRSRVRC